MSQQSTERGEQEEKMKKAHGSHFLSWHWAVLCVFVLNVKTIATIHDTAEQQAYQIAKITTPITETQLVKKILQSMGKMELTRRI